ncbi:MAG: hypothetical protein ABJE66_00310 [Deltaproteobacteria bacterium]
MMRALFVVSLLGACGGDDTRHILDACTNGSNSMTLSGPASFACHEPYKAQVTFTNESCTPLVVTGVKLSATTTTGACVPPGDYTYPGRTVGIGETMTVLDLTARPFCCTAPGPCPDPLECDESYTLTVQSAAGDISKSETVHLSLGGCDVVCPPPG